MKENGRRGVTLKALVLEKSEDLGSIGKELSNNTILILKVGALAQKNKVDLNSSVERLYELATSMGGDIARLGEERMVITPPGVRIHRDSK
jgi:uncharacterized protein